MNDGQLRDKRPTQRFIHRLFFFFLFHSILIDGFALDALMENTILFFFRFFCVHRNRSTRRWNRNDQQPNKTKRGNRKKLKTNLKLCELKRSAERRKNNV